MEASNIETSPTLIYGDDKPEVLYDKESLTRTDLITYPTSLDGFSYDKVWDGERCLITGLHPETELPVILEPADAKRHKPMESTRRGPIYTAEDIDLKCSEMDYENSWYR